VKERVRGRTVSRRRLRQNDMEGKGRMGWVAYQENLSIAFIFSYATTSLPEQSSSYQTPHLKPAVAEVFPESVEENEQPGVVNCRVSLLRRVSFRPAKTVIPAPLQQQRFSLASLAKTSVAARLRFHKTVWPEICTLNFTFYLPEN